MALSNTSHTKSICSGVNVVPDGKLMPVADSLAMSSHVDGVLLVIESGKSDKRAVSRAKTLLDKVNARTYGAVLNNVKRGDLNGYYGNKYRYYKYEDSNEEKDS